MTMREREREKEVESKGLLSHSHTISRVRRLQYAVKDIK
jgi:hypothetical protein